VPDDALLAACLNLLTNLGQRRARGGPPSLEEARALAAAVWPGPAGHEAAAQALSHPYLASTMLWRTLGQGMRGNPHHLRSRDADGGRLAGDLLALLRLHTRLWEDLPARVQWPAGGVAADTLVGDGGWCDLCGQCCCHCGVVPAPPAGVDYPAHWYHILAGEAVAPQPFCAFLFQALGQPLFFCGLHPIKPRPCSDFGRADCERGLPTRGLARGLTR
jgi:hypothetical protein